MSIGVSVRATKLTPEIRYSGYSGNPQMDIVAKDGGHVNKN